MLRISTLAVALCLSAAGAQAITLDFSNGSFDGTTDSFSFTNVATIGGQQVDMSVTSSPGIDSSNEANNGNFATDRFQVNLDSSDGNRSRLTFSFFDTVGAPVVLDTLTVGIYDLDFVRGEVVEVRDAVSVTRTQGSALEIVEGSTLRIRGASETNVSNPSDLSNLTAAQQDVSVLLDFVSVSSFEIDLAVERDGGGGRNFFFGNFSFSEPTVTTEFVPQVSVPAGAFLFLSALGMLHLTKRRSA
ncbi:MAG: hypothetical protein AAF844_12515 [Pseudomonadota bacterium]